MKQISPFYRRETKAQSVDNKPVEELGLFNSCSDSRPTPYLWPQLASQERE